MQEIEAGRWIRACPSAATLKLVAACGAGPAEPHPRPMPTLDEVLKKLVTQRDAAEARRTDALKAAEELKEAIPRVIREVVLPAARAVSDGLAGIKLAPEMKEGGEARVDGRLATRIVSIAFVRPGHVTDRVFTAKKPDFFASIDGDKIGVYVTHSQSVSSVSHVLVRAVPVQTLDEATMQEMFAEAMERIMAPIEADPGGLPKTR